MLRLNVFGKSLSDAIQIRIFERPLYTQIADEVEESGIEFEDKNNEISEADSSSVEDLEAEEKKSTIDEYHIMLKSRIRAKSKIYDYCRCNDFEWFCTFTFSPDLVDRYSYDAIVKKYQRWMDNFKRRKAPQMQYVVVPELHKDKAYHLHALLKNVPESAFKKLRKTDSKGRQLYKMTDYKLGLNEHSKISDPAKVSRYLTKYITKDLMWHLKGKKTYYPSRGLEKPCKGSMLMHPDNVLALEAYLKEIGAYHKICPVPVINNTMHLYEFRVSDCPPDLLIKLGLS